MKNDFLKQLIEEVFLNEFVKPDAKADDPFGAYFLAPIRKDKVPEESNTDLEQRFFKAVTKHVRSNNDRLLSSIFEQIYELAQQGTYKKFLLPPPGKRAYRLTKASASEAAKLLRLSIEEIEKDPNRGWYVEGGGTWESKGKDPIGSWSLEGTSKDLTPFVTIDHRRPVQILLVADPSKNKFLINPYEINKKMEPNQLLYNEETESISYGPVEFEEASFFYSKVLFAKRMRDFEVPIDRIHKELVQALGEKVTPGTGILASYSSEK